MEGNTEKKRKSGFIILVILLLFFVCGSALLIYFLRDTKQSSAVDYYTLGQAEDFKFDETGTVVTGISAEGYEKVKDEDFYIVNIPQTSPTGETITAIGDKAFIYNWEMIEVKIPPTIVTIGYQAFYNNWELREVTIPSSVEVIGVQAFHYNKNLTKVVFEDGDKKLTLSSQCFIDCMSLKELHIPSRLYALGSNHFSWCDSLEKITVDPNNPYYTSQDAEGNECNVLMDKQRKTIITACKNTVILDEIECLAEQSFAGVELADLKLPSNLKEVEQGTFNGASFRHITIPADVTLLGGGMLSDNTELLSVRIMNIYNKILQRDLFYRSYNVQSVIVEDKASYEVAITPVDKKYSITDCREEYKDLMTYPVQIEYVSNGESVQTDTKLFKRDLTWTLQDENWDYGEYEMPAGVWLDEEGNVIDYEALNTLIENGEVTDKITLYRDLTVTPESKPTEPKEPQDLTFIWYIVLGVLILIILIALITILVKIFYKKQPKNDEEIKPQDEQEKQDE